MNNDFQFSLLTQGFTDSEIQELLKIAKEKQYFKDQIIFLENDAADCLYILAEGKVCIERQLLLPSLPITKQIFMVKKGQVFGEMGLLEDVRRTATARAASQIRVIGLEYQELRKLFSNNPFLGYRFMTNLAVILGNRLRNMNKQWYNNKHARKHIPLELEYYG